MKTIKELKKEIKACYKREKECEKQLNEGKSVPLKGAFEKKEFDE